MAPRPASTRWSVGLGWRIEFGAAAEKELKAIDRTIARRIIGFLRSRVETSDDPRILGKRLTGHRLGELWRFRVGDYRIVASIEADVCRVLVVRIGHRSSVYE